MKKIKTCRITNNRSVTVVTHNGKFYSAIEENNELHFVREFETDRNSAYSDYYRRAAFNGVKPKD
jgi:hypothetical protein